MSKTRASIHVFYIISFFFPFSNEGVSHFFLTRVWFIWSFVAPPSCNVAAMLPGIAKCAASQTVSRGTGIN